MAINAATVVEIRVNGSTNNGAGWADLNPGVSVDYTQQDAAQLSLTDLATAGIGSTTLTSATGGFTAAMEGSLIKIRSGTNVNAGYYQVVGFTNTNTVTLDRAPDNGAGGIASGVGDLGGAGILEDTLFNTPATGGTSVDGMTYWLKNDGTHSPVAAVSMAESGSMTAVYNFIGYNLVRGDNPVGTDRPLIAMGTNRLTFNQYWMVQNFRMTGADTTAMQTSTGSAIINVRAENTDASAGHNTVLCGGSNLVFASEFICAAASNAVALITNSITKVFSCRTQGGSTGIRMGDYTVVANCVIEDAEIGIDFFNNGNDWGAAFFNTIYNCTTGIANIEGDNLNLLGNIVHTATTGFSNDSGTDLPGQILDYNLFYNISGNDVVGLVKGQHTLGNGDPLFNAPGAEDFDLLTTSPALNIVLQTSLGLAGVHNVMAGAIQNNPDAAGGGGGEGWW